MKLVTEKMGGIVIAFMVIIAAILSVIPQHAANAQANCPLSLTVPLNTSNGQSGVTFEVTALRSTSLCRFWTRPSSTGTHTIQVWRHPGGNVTANDGLWQWMGTGTVTMPTSGVDYEIPVDLNMLMNPGEKWGFALFSTSTIQYSNTGAINTYADSYISVYINGYGITGSATPPTTTAWSWSFYPRGFVGLVKYKEGCFFPPNIATAEISDAGGNPIAFAEVPSTIYAKYSLSYPAEESNYTVTYNFKKVGVASPAPPLTMYTYVVNAHKDAGVTLNGIAAISLPGTLQPGYYSVEISANSKNSCMNYADQQLPNKSLMLVAPGTAPCSVWPGDVNNDGLVNYGDRKSLNGYIYDANQRSSWLIGPARYLSGAGPLGYMQWVPQAAVPWQTPDGCYMDADGNGVVNNFDYVAIKLNWMRSHSAPRQGEGSPVLTFDMQQNYPNPFNPTTKITYSVPEPSNVRMVVTDMLGRTVAILIDGHVDTGVFEANFDGASLNSGNYVVTVVMQGVESGLSFSKSMRMTLVK